MKRLDPNECKRWLAARYPPQVLTALTPAAAPLGPDGRTHSASLPDSVEQKHELAIRLRRALRAEGGCLWFLADQNVVLDVAPIHLINSVARAHGSEPLDHPDYGQLIAPDESLAIASFAYVSQLARWSSYFYAASGEVVITIHEAGYLLIATTNAAAFHRLQRHGLAGATTVEPCEPELVGDPEPPPASR